MIHYDESLLEYVTHRRVTKNHYRYKIERLDSKHEVFWYLAIFRKSEVFWYETLLLGTRSSIKGRLSESLPLLVSSYLFIV